MNIKLNMGDSVQLSSTRKTKSPMVHTTIRLTQEQVEFLQRFESNTNGIRYCIDLVMQAAASEGVNNAK